MATSWGAFQVLGENYKLAGYNNVDEFVAAMRNSVSDHLNAFVNYVSANPHAKQAIQRKDWVAFARAYNGSGYKDFDYDTKLAAAYARSK